MNISYKVYQAIADVYIAHGNQKRKTINKNIPYISHSVSIALILASKGESENVIIASLFHDVLEDTDVKDIEIEKKYGKKVLALVKNVSEDKFENLSEQEKKITWEDRKKSKLIKLMNADRESQVIGFCDGFNNIQCIYEDIKEMGLEKTEKIFNAPMEKKIGLYKYYLENLWTKINLGDNYKDLIAEYEKMLKEIINILKKDGRTIQNFEIINFLS